MVSATNTDSTHRNHIIDSLTEQESEDLVSNLEFRTTFLVKSLVDACKSRRVFRSALTRLIKENIIKGLGDLDTLVAQSTPIDDGSEGSTDLDIENDDCDADLSGDEIPDVDSLLQMEVFNSSAVKNIGRFNCEFLRYEKLGQGGFGCAYRVHHLVDEKDYCVKELHLSIQKFEGSMPHMIAYARGVLREVFARCPCEHPLSLPLSLSPSLPPSLPPPPPSLSRPIPPPPPPDEFS